MHSMKTPVTRIAVSFFIAGFAITIPTIAQQEKTTELSPANGPLMTRWAAEVTPTNVHTEYPRPQMVRDEWMNL